MAPELGYEGPIYEPMEDRRYSGFHGKKTRRKKNKKNKEETRELQDTPQQVCKQACTSHHLVHYSLSVAGNNAAGAVCIA